MEPLPIDSGSIFALPGLFGALCGFVPFLLGFFKKVVSNEKGKPVAWIIR